MAGYASSVFSMAGPDRGIVGGIVSAEQKADGFGGPMSSWYVYS